MNQYLVWHERGGYIHVFAEDEQDAIEKFYESIESCIGHYLKICDCYGKKPLNRNNVIRPTRVELVPKKR